MEHQINIQGQKKNCLCHNVLKTLNIQNKESNLKAAKQNKTKSQITLKTSLSEWWWPYQSKS